MNIELARENMIEQQVRTWDVLDQNVLDAMRAVPRERFVPPAYQGLAFSDIQIPLGHDAVMMPPKLVGRMLQALELSETDRVLEIGTGSGYAAALAARLVARVDSVDLSAELVTAARERLQHLGLNNVTLTVANAFEDFEPGARYEAIAFTGALSCLPDWVADALTPDGRSFAVIGSGPVQTATVFRRASGGGLLHEALFETNLPYLKGAAPQPAFEF